MLISILFFPAALCFGYYLYCLSDQRYSFSEMDLNSDGFISFLEAMYVSESIEVAVTVDGKKCIEYVTLKDGHVFKRDCENGSL